MRLLLTYNLRRDAVSPEEAEFDSAETIENIHSALEAGGNKVGYLEESDTFYEDLKTRRDEAELVFNIAEGRRGAFREATVPFFLETLGIPYTGSDPRTLVLTLDKHLCNTYLRSCGIRCPASVIVMNNGSAALKTLKFPVILKPNFEGSSKGITGDSVVESYDELLSRIKNFDDGLWIAEEYIRGRELTNASLISTSATMSFRPMEVIFRNSGQYNVYSFDIKKTGNTHVEFDYAPDIGSGAEKEISEMTSAIVSRLGVRDLARLDFRLSEEGVPYFIEINPLPGLAKDYSDFPNIFKANGMSYEELIQRILKNAKERMR